MRLLRNKTSWLLTTTAIVGMAVAFMSTTALASPLKQAIVLDPYIKELTIKANDQRANFDLKITNNSGKDGNFKLVAVDFGTLYDTGGILFAGANESDLLKKYGLANWLSLPTDPIPLKQGQTRTVQVSVVNDAKLSPGGHYGAILISPSFGAAPSTNAPKINVNQTISCLVLAIKQGGDVYDLNLNRVSDNHNLFKAPNKVTLSFHNPGNSHVVPRGIVYLQQNNRVVARGIINEESGFVLPETNRTFTVNLRPEATYRSLFVTTYKIKTDYRYDGFERYASSSYQIRVLNVINIVGFIVILWLFRLVVRRRRKAR